MTTTPRHAREITGTDGVSDEVAVAWSDREDVNRRGGLERRHAVGVPVPHYTVTWRGRRSGDVLAVRTGVLWPDANDYITRDSTDTTSVSVSRELRMPASFVDALLG